MSELGAAMWSVLLELAPWLLLGAAIAAVLHVALPRDFVRRALGGRGGVLRAVLLGVPMPLCSCGVIPAGIGLKRDGASNGASIGKTSKRMERRSASVRASSRLMGALKGPGMPTPRTLPAPSASTARQATSEESTPPLMPTIAWEKPVFAK